MTDADAPGESIVLDDPEPGVRRIRLNRPDALNAFNMPMYASLLDAFESVRNDPAVRVVVLTGAGRGFSAGHDIRSAAPAAWTPPGLGRVQTARYTMDRIAALPIVMRALPQPVIAAVNGVAAGIGFALAVAADIAIAAQSAKFVNAIHNAGTGAELGLSWLLPRAVGTQRAAEILYTARAIHADEAAAMGLVLRSVADEELETSVLELARAIATNSPLGIWLTKQSFMLGQSISNLEAAMEMESRAAMLSQSTQDAAEKRAAAVEKRPPRFTQQ